MRKSTFHTSSILKHAVAGAVVLAMSALITPARGAEQSKPPRVTKPRLTVDGRPDLQGTWTNSTATPFERPPELAGQTLLTAEQAAAFEQRMEDFRTHKSIKLTEVGHDHEAFIDIDVKVLPTMQSSMVVEPADGRLPLRPEAERKRDYNLTNYDSYESMSPWDRCITRGPAPLLPANYNNGYQIVQTPTHIVILAEMIHEARVIPLNGSAHIDSRIKSWAGDARGHWEGDTLVVDTTNFNGKGWLVTHNSVGRLRGVPFSESLHIVERFTRVNFDTLNYEITIDDPKMFTSTWKASLPLQRDDGYKIFEYACHEGNSATDAILRGARTQEGAVLSK
ncbi:MAG: hypothetical protein H7Y02_04120 [Candidatus Obscuribacterales bacterium]|nr:hypothetical protein [Steroidobacteraceae bacterium]